MRRFVALVVLLAAVLSGCSNDLRTPGQDESAHLPKVTLQGLSGQPAVDLATLKGPTVVNLFASWCGPCKRELPIYAAFARANAGKVGVLGINFQETSTSSALSLLKQSQVGFPVVADPDGHLQAIGLPKLILIDAQGRIAHQEYVEITSAAQLDAIVKKYLPGTLS